MQAYDAGMQRPHPDSVLDAVAATARATAGLDLLILFGSRARGNARPGADWDFGYLADAAADIPGLLAAQVEALEDDRIDLVDLDRASGLLRYRAARDELLVYEATPELFDRYRLQAAQFWCDNAPVSNAGTTRSWRRCGREPCRQGSARRVAADMAALRYCSTGTCTPAASIAARTAAAVAGLLTMFMPRCTPAAMSNGVQP